MATCFQGLTMARPKSNINATRTTIEIENKNVVAMLCAALNMSIKDYINRLIREDMMRRGEHFSNLYFGKKSK